MRSTRSPSWIERALGAGQRPVPPHVFALDAGRLRYGCFRGANGSRQLTEYHAVELPPELFGSGAMGGSARDAAVLRERLAELVGRIGGEVEAASLVLPDAWVRVTFADLDALPRAEAERSEVLRFKLRRLVPFRVEDLRLDWSRVAPLAGDGGWRVLLLFGVEAALQQFESLFSEQGIRLGHIGNETLGVLAAAQPALENLDLAGLLHVADGGYSLVLTRHGEPVVYRLKTALPGVGDQFVLRDLRLTRKFLQEQLRDVRLRRLLLAGEGTAAGAWRPRLEDVFGVPVDLVAASWAPAGGAAPPVEGEDLAPLFGAACRTI